MASANKQLSAAKLRLPGSIYLHVLDASRNVLSFSHRLRGEGFQKDELKETPTRAFIPSVFPVLHKHLG